MPCKGPRPYRTPPTKKSKKSRSLTFPTTEDLDSKQERGKRKKLCFLLRTPEEDGDSRAVDSTMKGPFEKRRRRRREGEEGAQIENLEGREESGEKGGLTNNRPLL